VLHPPQSWHASEVNDNALVLRVNWCGLRFLFPGDIQKEAEAALARTDCQADVIKVPHHGSRTSSSPALLDAVNPSWCVVSTGGRNGREPVDDGVLARYRARNGRILRTDISGGVQFRYDDGNVTVETVRHR